MTVESFAHYYQPATRPGTPTLLLLHGTGGDEHSLVQLGASLSPASALLSPRGQVLEHGNPRFFRRLAEGVFDIPDLIARTNALADWIEEATAKYQIDPASLMAVGYSNGANIAASMMLLRPNSLAGGVFFRAMMPLKVETLPDLSGRRVLLAAGEADAIVPHSSIEQLASTLSRANADVTLSWQRADHRLTSADVTLAAEWLLALAQ